MIADLYTFGVLVTVFTHDVWYAPAVAQLLILFVTYAAHAGDHSTDDVWLAATALFSAAVWLGVVIGALAAITFRLPRLVYTAVFYDEGLLRAAGDRGAAIGVNGHPLNDQLVAMVTGDTPIESLEGSATTIERQMAAPLAVRCDPRFFLCTLALVGLVAPWVLSGALDSVGARVALVLCSSLLAIAVGVYVSAAWLRRGTTESADRQFARGRMQFKYTTTGVILWAIPAIVNNSVIGGYVITPLTLVATYGAFVIVTRRAMTLDDPYLGDRATRLRQTPLLFVSVLGTLHGTTYVIDWVSTQISDGDTLTSFFAVLALWFVHAVVLLIFHYFVDWDHWVPVQALRSTLPGDDDDDNDDEQRNATQIGQHDGRLGDVQRDDPQLDSTLFAETSRRVQGDRQRSH